MLKVFRRRAIWAALAALLTLAAAWVSIVDETRPLSIDLLALLEGRSPRPRADANLTSAKAAKLPRTASGNLEDDASDRALGKLFPQNESHQGPWPEPFPGDLEPLAGISGLQAAPTQILPADELFEIARGGDFQGNPELSFGGGVGASNGHGWGDPDHGGDAGSPELEPTSAIPAVAEPETWGLMLLGMALCGASMRRKRRPQPVEA